MTIRRASLASAAAFMLVLAAGCHKKAPPPPPPPPPVVTPQANKPTVAYFTAEPTTVSSGQPSSLRWSVTDATSVQIDNGIGAVSPNGRRAVYPTGTTTYTLTATGPSGSTDAQATVTVSTPPAPAPVQGPSSAESAAQILAHQVQDIHFDYDKSDIRPQDQPTLQADANALKTIFSMDPNFVVTIEGHCDERGSAEYNIALGDRRAAATRDALAGLGVPGDKLKTISYGKERPLCTDATEDCYQRNRRAHFSAGQ
ncbi:MAG: OmpA family protein [Acidobacteriaceae bacterium]|nr:OmpA family protein [Acidobacteriaceae bacterium]MBV9296150.1 OmpA family protein [Acidobacteriaceae bacterium]MBV9766597.1 OmpA family protein [Acidobacteriaceae bacterium]